MVSADFFLSRSRIIAILSFSFLVCCVSCFVIVYQSIYALADFNFAAVGDWGCDAHTDNTVRNIVAKNPEFVLGLGDYSYYPTGTCWFNKVVPIDSITKISIGNHEDDSVEGFSGYMSHFGLSKTYYSFNHQNVHFLVMDTDRNSFLIGSDQYNFVVNDLQTASQDPDIDWIVIYFHKPIYTSPYISTLTSFRDTYHPLFDQYGVDLVLQGHFHNYQRTFPLKYNPNNPSNPIVTSTNAYDYQNPDGPIFAIVGTGGINLHPLSGKASFVSSQQDYFFGHLDVKITNNGTKLEGKFYRSSGQIDDAFSISKGIAYMPPTAYNKNITVTKNTQQVIRLTGSDPNNYTLNYAVVTPPTNGSVSGTAHNLTYTPNQDHVGFDKFTFKVNNSALESNIATVSIAVVEPSQENGYDFLPRLSLTGSNYHDEPSSHSLQLPQFSVATWFKTSSDYVSNAYIVTKGGTGSDNVGQNQNYGIWITRSERIIAGFETSRGVDHLVTSIDAYNDGQWHYAVVTYDGSTLILYIDGAMIDTISTEDASPETSGTKPVRVGANPRVTPPENFFTGEVDEVRIWNVALTAQDVADAFSGSISRAGQVLHLSFSDLPPIAYDQAVVINRNTPKVITLTGTHPNNGPLTYSVVTPPANGTLSGTAQNVTYTPNLGHVGFDKFTFKVNNSALESKIATVTMIINNTPPIAASQAVTVNKNHSTYVTLTAIDANKDFLAYTVVTLPTNGTLSGTAPNLTYHPSTDYVGDDSFTFKANDGISDSNRATVSITVRDPENEKYDYAQSLVLTGSNYHDEPSSSQLQLTEFSVAAWFKTSSEYVSNAYIVTKGGTGSESAGQNQNYGIWMTSSGRIRAGFETSTGVDHLVTSIDAYNDGQWHYAVVTYSGSTLRLYFDGAQIDAISTLDASPETFGVFPIRVGANSRVTPPENYFIGEVDEVRIWNDALTAEQATDAFMGISFNTLEQVLYLNFGS